MSVVLTNPRMAYRIVSAEPEVKPSRLPRFVQRFLSDCRDLWTLLTQGQPKDDPIMPWRMMVELAKATPVEDLDAWEADMFARSGAWWFDPARYDGTPLAWPKQARAEIKAVNPTRAGATIYWPYGLGLQNSAVALQNAHAQQMANYQNQLANMQMNQYQARTWYDEPEHHLLGNLLGTTGKL